MIYFKKILLCTTVLCAVQITAAAQSGAKTVHTVTQSSGNILQSAAPASPAALEFSGLGQGAAYCKALYEEAFQISMSPEAFREKCKSTAANKQDWLTVKNLFADNPDVDLSDVQGLLNAFDEKM